MQRSKIDDSYNSWSEILFNVPQGSILGPVLCDIFLFNLFLVIKYRNSECYADDNIICNSEDRIDSVILSLQISAKRLFQWFSVNFQLDVVAAKSY